MTANTYPASSFGQEASDRDWMDSLLETDARDARAEYIADGGFTARVMQLLPVGITLPKWRKPAVVALWGLALAGIGFALPGAAVDVLRETYRLVGAQPVSLSGMAGALLLAGALSWSAAAYTLRRE